jgi:hypothetical protein
VTYTQRGGVETETDRGREYTDGRPGLYAKRRSHLPGIRTRVCDTGGMLLRHWITPNAVTHNDPRQGFKDAGEVTCPPSSKMEDGRY